MWTLLTWIVKLVLLWYLVFVIIHGLVTHFVLWFEARLKHFEEYPNGKMPSVFVFIKSFFKEICLNFIRCLLSPFYACTPQKIEKWMTNYANYQMSFVSSTSNGPDSSIASDSSLDASPASLNTSPIYPSTISSTNSNIPILLVHGYAQNQTDWIWFWQKLKKQTKNPIFTVNLTPALASIKELAKAIDKQIQIIQEETKQNQVILIGHSMGGLVASYYAENLAKPDTIEKVILIGSPIHGTKTVSLGMGENVIEMRPNSPFLASLREQMQSSKIPYYFIASQFDNMIIPWHSGLLDRADENLDNNFVLEDPGHLSLLVSSKVVNKVSNWLGS